MKPADFDIDELIESLTGTCKSISEFLPDGMTEDDLTTEDHEHIDQEIFLCTVCGWWCEISEETGSAHGDELVCSECDDDKEDDEEEEED